MIAEVEAMAQSLDEASHDERLATGMLYRDAATLIRSLARQVAAKDTELKQLTDLINADLPCAEGCDKYGHVAGCPYAEFPAQMLHMKQRLERAEAERDRLRQLLADSIGLITNLVKAGHEQYNDKALDFVVAARAAIANHP